MIHSNQIRAWFRYAIGIQRTLKQYTRLYSSGIARAISLRRRKCQCTTHFIALLAFLGSTENKNMFTRILPSTYYFSAAFRSALTEIFFDSKMQSSLQAPFLLLHRKQYDRHQKVCLREQKDGLQEKTEGSTNLKRSIAVSLYGFIPGYIHIWALIVFYLDWLFLATDYFIIC